MRIGGIQGTSLKDYPEKICSIFFTLGCNFRCHYCYNKKLVFEELKPIDEKRINNFLEERKNFSEAIMISGGEPTLQEDLPQFMKKIKSMGYLTGIETNGSRPEVIEKLINEKLIDFIAMDIKAPLEKYEKVTGVFVDVKKIRRSIEIVKKFKNHEFRTTFVPTLLDENDIIEIAKLIKGAKVYRLQQFVNNVELISKEMEKVKPYPIELFDQVAAKIKHNFERVCIES
jgi:pyruvate formate lyase activating enzyme